MSEARPKFSRKTSPAGVNGRYASERFDPKVPACVAGPMTLHFNGRGLFASGPSPFYFEAVSGKRNGQGFDYSRARQTIPNEGPIPAGRYWIQPSELQENAWYRFANATSAWGNFWITIHPYPSTQTHGRGGFFIHGGAQPGSAGCIDLASNMDAFVAALRSALRGKEECYVPLTVRYTE